MTLEAQTTRCRVLLVDDDPAVLETYNQLLAALPSAPEVLTAASGNRALAMLESQPFRLLICDLKMPRMDGLQLLSIVRRKYPELRTVVLTGVADEQFRSRVYSLGVDLFWHKPGNDQEMKLLLECLESLLDREADSGFRGLQSKSLVDIVQLECLSQSSSVLRITNNRLTGKIWIQHGEILDAEAGELQGEPAFLKILSWRAGTFESLPAEPTRTRTIFKSCDSLLLESAQHADESQEALKETPDDKAAGPLAQLSKIEGIEFAVAMKQGGNEAPAARGIEDPQQMAAWAKQTLENFRSLGEMLNAGPLEHFEGLGTQRHVSLAHQGDTDLCVGWGHDSSVGMMRKRMTKVLALWAS